MGEHPKRTFRTYQLQLNMHDNLTTKKEILMTQFYRVGIFLLMTLFINYSYSQEPLSDRTYYALLNEVRELSSTSPKQAINKLENMLLALNLSHGQRIETYFRLSNVAYSIDNNEKTIKYADLSLDLIGKNDQMQFAARLLYNKAYAMNVLMLDGVEDTAKKSITLAQSYDDIDTIISSHQILGEYYLKITKFTQAHTYIKKSIELAVQIDNELLLANGYALHGTIYKETEEYQNSLDALEKSLSIYEKYGHKHNIFTIQLVIAEILAKQELSLQSERYYNDIIANGTPDTQFHFQAHVGISDLKIKQKDFLQAMIYLNKVELNLHNVEDLSTKIHWYLNKIEALIHLNMRLEAKSLIDDVLHSKFFPLEKIIDLNNANFHLLQSEYFELTNDHKSALGYYKKFHTLFMANFQNKSNTLFKDIREKYSSDKKDEQLKDMGFNLTINQLELEKKAQESQYQKIIILTSLFLFLIILYALIKQIIMKKKLSQMLHTDALTNVCNRYSLIKKGNAVFNSRVSEARSMSVILLDIDNFKHINDTFGHSKGDDVLKAIAKIGSLATSDGDWFGRLGGEEFVSILPNSSEKNALDAAERIRIAIYTYDWNNMGLNYQISASIGVASVSLLEDERNITNFNALLNCSDKAMYSAKNTGKNQVVLYSSLIE